MKHARNTLVADWKWLKNIQRQLEYAEPLSKSHNTMLNHLTEVNTRNHLKGRSKPKLNHQEQKLNMVLNHSRQKQNTIFECLTTIKAEATQQCLTIHGRSLTSMLNHHGQKLNDPFFFNSRGSWPDWTPGTTIASRIETRKKLLDNRINKWPIVGFLTRLNPGDRDIKLQTTQQMNRRTGDNGAAQQRVKRDKWGGNNLKHLASMVETPNPNWTNSNFPSKRNIHKNLVSTFGQTKKKTLKQ